MQHSLNSSVLVLKPFQANGPPTEKPGGWLKCHSVQVFFTHFPSKNYPSAFFISETLGFKRQFVLYVPVII